MKNILNGLIYFLIAVFIFSGVFSLNFFKESYEYKTHETLSGLKVLSIKDDSLPYIRYNVQFLKAGSDYSFEDKAGLATLTAYLLDQGAGDLNSEQIQEELNQLGTELDVSLGKQSVQLSLSGLSWHKEKLFDLFKKIIISPHFKEQELEILRKQFLTKRIRSLDSPSFVSSTFMRKSLFKGMIGEPSNGNLISLSEITLEDIKSFYKTQYKEGNPVFSLVGNFDSSFEKEFYSFVDQNFSYHEQDLIEKPEPVYQSSQYQLLTKKDLVQAEINLSYLLFPFPKEDYKTVLSLKLANFILGGPTLFSRLSEELREKRGLTYSVYSSVSLGKVYGIFSSSGATKNSSVREFIELLFLNLKKVKEEGVTLEELNKAKNQLKMNHLKSIESPEEHLDIVLYYTEYLGLDPKLLNHYVQILDSISLEDVNAVFDKFILSSEFDRIKDIKKTDQINEKAYLQIQVYGNPSIQSQLENIENLPELQVISFEDYFQEELSLKKQLQEKL